MKMKLKKRDDGGLFRCGADWEEKPKVIDADDRPMFSLSDDLDDYEPVDEDIGLFGRGDD